MKKGFTLVEVVIASAIMVLALTGFLASFLMARRSILLCENRMNTVHEIRERMETLLTLPYTATELSYGVHSLSNGFYSVSTNAQYPSSVKDISMTLRWVNPACTMTSTVSVSSSLCTELH